MGSRVWNLWRYARFAECLVLMVCHGVMNYMINTTVLHPLSHPTEDIFFLTHTNRSLLQVAPEISC